MRSITSGDSESDVEAGRRALAVDQHLGVAAAEAAHADLAAAAAAADGHAGHALEHIQHIGVAVFDDLGVADDDLAGGVVAARVIGFGGAFHLDLLHFLGVLRRLGLFRDGRLLGVDGIGHRGHDGGGYEAQAEWEGGWHVNLFKFEMDRHCPPDFSRLVAST
jgi:hypothetical protein